MAKYGEDIDLRKDYAAKNKDCQGDPPKFPAQGSWSRSRMGGRARGPMRDGGNTGNLID